MEIILKNIVEIIEKCNSKEETIKKVEEFINGFPQIVNESNMKKDLIEAVETYLGRKLTQDEPELIDEQNIEYECLESMLNEINSIAINFCIDNEIIKVKK